MDSNEGIFCQRLKEVLKQTIEVWNVIEPTNNRAERQLRPNVIMRKITFGNQSDKGAEAHQVIMTIIQTGLANGIKPLDIFRAIAIRPLTSYDELPRPP